MNTRLWLYVLAALGAVLAACSAVNPNAVACQAVDAAYTTALRTPASSAANALRQTIATQAARVTDATLRRDLVTFETGVYLMPSGDLGLRSPRPGADPVITRDWDTMIRDKNAVDGRCRRDT